MKGINLNTILLIAVGIFVYIQLRSCFGKTHLPEQMIRNEEQLKALEKQRLSDSVFIVETVRKYDSLISVSFEKSGQLATKYQTVKTIYEKVPVIINDFDREQLRRAITGF